MMGLRRTSARQILLLTLLAATSIGAMTASASGEPEDAGATPAADRVRLLVRLAPGADRSAFRAAVEGRDAWIAHEYRLLPDWVAVRNLPAVAVEDLTKLPGVLEVRNDRRVRAHLIESLPLMHADSASLPGYSDGAGITVCVLDTGVNKTHPAFSGALVAEKDFVNNDNDATDDEGHGTHVAGTVLSRDPTYAGVAPSAQLAVGKVLDDSGSGYDSDIIAGIDWCSLAAAADIINMSLGGEAWPGACDFDPLAQAVNSSVDLGVVHVVASGNDADFQHVTTPACASGAIAVGAVYDEDIGPATFPACSDPTTAPDQVTCYSNGSPVLNVVAPGSRITAPDLGVGFDSDHGTSLASAHVAGLAARLLGEHPEYTPRDVRRAVAWYAIDIEAPGFDDRSGHGRVDALSSLSEPLPVICGADPECNDLDPCTEDLCRDGFCERRPLCDDGDACTVDTCVAGTCSWAPLNPDDGMGCTSDSCDPCTGPAHLPSVEPCNDTCLEAIPLAVGQTVSGDTSLHAPDYDSGCASGRPQPGPDVVYKILLGPSDTVRFDLDSSSDSGIHVFMELPGGGNCDTARCVTGIDDNPGPGPEVIDRFTAPYEGEYFVVVDTWDEAGGGPFTLTVTPICDPDWQGRPCDDHNACTLDDTCQGGACAPPGPGQVPDGLNLPGIPLTIAKSLIDPGFIELSWGPSCGTSTNDYSIHEGEIPFWDAHTSKACTTAGATFAAIEPGPLDHYYIVVPLDDLHEGSYGRASDGDLRPPSAVTCRPLMLPGPCP
jgi:hypothetical protein